MTVDKVSYILNDFSKTIIRISILFRCSWYHLTWLWLCIEVTNMYFLWRTSNHCHLDKRHKSCFPVHSHPAATIDRCIKRYLPQPPHYQQQQYQWLQWNLHVQSRQQQRNKWYGTISWFNMCAILIYVCFLFTPLLFICSNCSDWKYGILPVWRNHWYHVLHSYSSAVHPVGGWVQHSRDEWDVSAGVGTEHHNHQ